MRPPIVALVLAAGLATATIATPTQAPGQVRHGVRAPGAERVAIIRRPHHTGAVLHAPGAERVTIHRDNRGRRIVNRN